MREKQRHSQAVPQNGKRVFFALLPDAATIAAIDRHAAQYSPLAGKKVDPANYHITLRFLGHVDQRTLDALRMDCQGLHVPAITMTISDVGWWKKAGILWLGPKQIPDSLQDLVDQLSALAGQRKLPRENRPYVPHITLMRKVMAAPLHPLVKPFTWQADSFSLMESFLHPEGVEYRELESWPLR